MRCLIVGHLNWKNSSRRFSKVINNLKLELAAHNCLKKAIKSSGTRDGDKNAIIACNSSRSWLMASGILHINKNNNASSFNYFTFINHDRGIYVKHLMCIHKFSDNSFSNERFTARRTRCEGYFMCCYL